MINFASPIELPVHLGAVYLSASEGDPREAAWNLSRRPISDEDIFCLHPLVAALRNRDRSWGRRLGGDLKNIGNNQYPHLQDAAEGLVLATVERIPPYILKGSSFLLRRSDHPSIRPIFQSPETLLADIRRIVKPVVEVPAASEKISLLEEVPTKEAVFNLVRRYDDLVAAGKRDPEKIWEDLDEERELLMTAAVLFLTGRYNVQEATARLFLHPSHSVRISAIKVQLALNENSKQAMDILYNAQERMFLRDIHSGNDERILQAVALLRELVRLGEIKALHWLRTLCRSNQDAKVRHAAFIALDDLDLLEEDI